MSGGGSGGSGEQVFKWNDQLMPHWINALDEAQTLTDPERGAGYRQYPGQRIAGFDNDQEAAKQMIRHYSQAPGDFLYGKGNTQLQKTVGGDYLTGNQANPFVQPNTFMGESPYFEDVVGRGKQKITEAYKNGTSADTTRLFNMSGAFGGSAHQKALANNESALAEQLGAYDSQMRNQQYDRSAGLYENFLNRGSGAFEGERGRMMGAAGMSQADQGLTYERARQMMGVGDMERGMTQDFLNMYLQDWQDQQNYPLKMLDTYTGILSRAQGGMAPNSVTTQPGYQANPFSQLLGAGLLGYGMMTG